MKDIFKNINKEFVEVEPFKLEPIGLKPREVWLLERMNEVNVSILRYKQFNKVIPREWIDELVEIANIINKLYPPL